MARSGRNASGRGGGELAVELATASSAAASAASRRPRSLSRLARLFSDVARSGRKASGRAAASSRQMLHRLLGRGQRRLAPPEVAEAVGEVVERAGEVGAEGVGPGGGELAVELRPPPRRGQRRLAPPEGAEAGCRGC